MAFIRQPAVAGSFYPAQPHTLLGMLTEFLAAAHVAGGIPKAVIAPHAGYIYSSPVAASAYPGSTGAVTTIEYEEGALADLRRTLDRLAPADTDYAHNARWGDGNGFSHVRSALLKTSLAVPVVDGRPVLGTWQPIVVLNLDNRTREREVVAVVTGT